MLLQGPSPMLTTVDLALPPRQLLAEHTMCIQALKVQLSQNRNVAVGQIPPSNIAKMYTDVF